MASEIEGYDDAVEPFPNFFARVFPSYMATITADIPGKHGYYLSDTELLALCRCQQVSVVLLQYIVDEDSLEYHSHTMSPLANEIRWVSIRVLTKENQKLRTHFSKVVVEDVDGQPGVQKPIDNGFFCAL